MSSTGKDNRMHTAQIKLNFKKIALCLVLATANFTLHSAPKVKDTTPVQELELLLADAKRWTTVKGHLPVLGYSVVGYCAGSAAPRLYTACMELYRTLKHGAPRFNPRTASKSDFSKAVSICLSFAFFTNWLCKTRAEAFETKANVLATKLTTCNKEECAKVIADLEVITAKKTPVYSWLHLPLNPFTPIVDYQRITGHFNTQVRMIHALQKVYATAQARLLNLRVEALEDIVYKKPCQTNILPNATEGDCCG
jgi:hypothetical protein